MTLWHSIAFRQVRELLKRISDVSREMFLNDSKRIARKTMVWVKKVLIVTKKGKLFIITNNAMMKYDNNNNTNDNIFYYLFFLAHSYLKISL